MSRSNFGYSRPPARPRARAMHLLPGPGKVTLALGLIVQPATTRHDVRLKRRHRRSTAFGGSLAVAPPQPPLPSTSSARAVRPRRTMQLQIRGAAVAAWLITAYDRCRGRHTPSLHRGPPPDFSSTRRRAYIEAYIDSRCTVLLCIRARARPPPAMILYILVRVILGAVSSFFRQ